MVPPCSTPAGISPIQPSFTISDRNGMLMVSRSRDGEWMARVLEYMGFQSARGSQDKGGGTALRRMIGHIRAGYPGGLIADGSQGPPLVAQNGNSDPGPAIRGAPCAREHGCPAVLALSDLGSNGSCEAFWSCFPGFRFPPPGRSEVFFQRPGYNEEKPRELSQGTHKAM